jgi:hypothetical protein
MEDSIEDSMSARIVRAVTVGAVLLRENLRSYR